MTFPQMKIVDEPEFKDGDDDGVTELENISIRVVDNGYVVKFEDTDEIIERVYTDKIKLLMELETNL